MNKDDLIIDKNEVLRYLGYRGQNLSENLINKIHSVRIESKSLFQPKFIYDIYFINKSDENVEITGTSLKLLGKDINKLLKDCDKCILMAVTLGNNIERRIRFYERVDLTKAVILDACATTAVEEICDLIQNKIKEECIKEEESLTFRYSPGYGDLSLDIQKKFINVLNAERRIGVTVSEHMLLFPRKSVTAIIGIKNGYGNNCKYTCTNCSNYNTCYYRKEGKNHGCKGVH